MTIERIEAILDGIAADLATANGLKPCGAAASSSRSAQSQTNPEGASAAPGGCRVCATGLGAPRNLDEALELLLAARRLPAPASPPSRD